MLCACRLFWAISVIALVFQLLPAGDAIAAVRQIPDEWRRLLEIGSLSVGLLGLLTLVKSFLAFRYAPDQNILLGALLARGKAPPLGEGGGGEVDQRKPTRSYLFPSPSVLAVMWAAGRGRRASHKDHFRRASIAAVSVGFMSTLVGVSLLVGGLHRTSSSTRANHHPLHLCRCTARPYHPAAWPCWQLMHWRPLQPSVRAAAGSRRLLFAILFLHFPSCLPPTTRTSPSLPPLQSVCLPATAWAAS